MNIKSLGLCVETTEEDPSKLYLKCRLPAALVKRHYFDSFPAYEAHDCFYDDGKYSRGKQNVIVRCRLNENDSNTMVEQVTVDISSSMHTHVQRKGSLQLLESLNPFLAYTFERFSLCPGLKGIDLCNMQSNDIYLDKITNPTSYEIVSIRLVLSDDSSISIAQRVNNLLDIVKILSDSTCPYFLKHFQTLLSCSSPSTQKLLPLFPASTKFMYLLKCVDKELHDGVFRKVDGCEDSIRDLLDNMVHDDVIRDSSVAKMYYATMYLKPFLLDQKLPRDDVEMTEDTFVDYSTESMKEKIMNTERAFVVPYIEQFFEQCKSVEVNCNDD